MSDRLLTQGLALERAGNAAGAARIYGEILAKDPRHYGALYQLANIEFMAGRFERAEALFAHAANAKPAAADAYFGRGCALQRLGRPADAVAAYEKALTLTPADAEAWSNRGAALLDMGRLPDAFASFERAIAIEPRHANAWFNRGTALMGLRRYAEAIQSFDRVLMMDPRHIAASINRAIALMGEGRHEDALAGFGKALALDPNRIDVLNNRAALLFERARYGEAMADAEKLIAQNPDYPYALGLLLRTRVHCCDWRDLDRQLERISAGIAGGKRVIQPFALLALRDDPAEHLRAAAIHAGEAAPAHPAIWKGERYRHERIRIAYLSADFSAHATAHLMAGVFEAHDRARFETVGISYGRDDGSLLRARIRGAFDRFLDAAAMPDAETAAFIRQNEIDIAVDLKGYTQEARQGILAHRAAPVQAQYLGYPGTMGTGSIDYIIADRIVIPKESERWYRERVVWLPGSYQCNDSQRARPDRSPSRREAGLPETGFVFCCFNAIYKILPEIFSAWMRILSAVDGSVLWLLDDNAAARQNLRREAELRGIAGERLIFAPKLTPDAHLARHHLAGLFLDTLPYGAHTTASDALWMGLPLVTCIGRYFPGRVAASLLSAAGAGELIARSLADYEAFAIDLARNPARLTAIKEKIESNRISAPLFDTAAFTRGLEAAFVRMRDMSTRGEPPRSFEVERIY